MILGAVLAGGQSSRFGSDKALAALGGQTLLARAIASLEAQCDSVIVVGRGEVHDRPRPGMGPLGGINAALHHAASRGYSEVLTCGVDCAGLAPQTRTDLSPAPAYVADQPVIGLWPASAAPALDVFLATDAKHSMRAFAEMIGARPVTLPTKTANINTREDLASAQEHIDGL
ncbi:molybdenum cofactor guanylyltransferase [Novosphingobium fuchskuhlense]|uniref:Molybdenum cofactor guanylyltransferase n=1 Tax=Novosphingobium fuchskuhlense TaxID=1117702 RepID=A0A117UZ81_9SPHN|nr:molybdenum cofactor guanylyltransferase [Novosphingobium fuchskuhlense]KUR73572.1 molybdenum cofactor guanylyltransferase [Novosphingobium fuchskuhlense]